jgi:hypothetical protein
MAVLLFIACWIANRRTLREHKMRNLAVCGLVLVESYKYLGYELRITLYGFTRVEEMEASSWLRRK